MALQNRGQARKSPAPSPLPPPSAKPRLPSRPRVLPPCRPGPRRRLWPRWKASWIGSTSGRPTIRRPQAGNSTEAEAVPGWGGVGPLRAGGGPLLTERGMCVYVVDLFCSFPGATSFSGLTLGSGSRVLFYSPREGRVTCVCGNSKKRP